MKGTTCTPRAGWIVAGALIAAMTAPQLASAEPIKLTMVGRASPQEHKWEQAMIALYEQRHPNVTVEELAGVDDNNLAKLTTLFASGEGPDVWGHGGNIATERYNGWVLNQKPLIDRDSNELQKDDFFVGAWNAYIGPQFAVGLPFIATPSPLWVNVDLLEKAGLAIPPIDWNDSSWTFDKFREYARKLTKVDSGGKVVQWGAGLQANGNLERYTWPTIGGGTFWDMPQAWQSGVPKESHFSDPSNVAVYDQYVSMVKDGIATTDYWGSWFAGRVGMVGGAGGWLGFGQYSQMKFRWSMAPMPYSPNTGDVRYTDTWLISSRTQHVKEAWDLVKFLSSQEAMAAYVKFAVFPPSRRSVLQPFLENAAKSSGYMTAAQVLQSLEGGINHGIESPDHRLAGQVDYDAAIRPIFTKIWNGTISPKEGLAQADQVVKPIMEKYAQGLQEGHVAQTR